MVKSALWGSHHDVEECCVQNTELLVKELGVYFEDHDVEGQERNPFNDLQGIDAHRHAVEKCDTLIHVNRMQLEVMRRATQRKQEDLKALIAERSRIVARADIDIAHNSIPTLPNETIAQILSYLYWMEHGQRDRWNTGGRIPLRDTTLQRLISDSATSDNWRNFIQQQIPIAIVCDGSSAALIGNGDARLIGHYPTTIPTRTLQAEENSGEILARRSTTIYANLSEKNGIEELEEIREYPWYSLVLASNEQGSSKELTGKFVQRFVGELANLHRLEIRPRGLVDQSAPVWNFNEDENSLLQSNLESNLRVVRAPSGLLPDLRPILNNVAILDIAINFGDPDTITARESVNALLEGLSHYSSTLTVLKLAPARDTSFRCGTIFHLRSRSPSIGEDTTSSRPKKPRLCRVAFPHLEQLKLSLPMPTIHDILSAVDCILLSRLDIAVYESWVSSSMHRHSPRDAVREISTSFIHNIFPKLRSFVVRLDFALVLRSYESLEAPDDSGDWLLPMLDSLELHINNWTEEALLESAGRVIINRLKTVSTTSIRSIRVTGIYGFSVGDPGQLYDLYRKHFNAFKLFVPEVIISEDASGDTW
ncbi:hypothetical protein SCHPADRAFT_936428 [Schizopora paradoxa]|uniref:Uncharacterized protein n=1 Tax=Schizopora paradoxa TaxID=27342 RepID=A0A0H2S2A3_9AGAM|nr:hypothetical protein SCHPADRAFT_936428 [Schizopora paradoxa]